MSESTDDDVTATASDAFKTLSNGTRLDILRALFEADATGEVRPDSKGFSELYEATDENTTAGFAYHLRQLVGRFVEKDADTERYALTYAGLQVARGLAAGTYTESVDQDPVPVADPCPFCADETLELRVADNVATVACAGCERDVLSLPFPPGGFRSHDDDSLPAAFDRHHRHRIALLTGGSCPECGGRVDSRLEPLDESENGTEASPARATLECAGCGYTVRCPATLTVLSEPSVVAFYHDHGLDLRERPIWNVGAEWREAVVSTDPLAVRVTTTLGDESLSLYLGADGSVVYEDRSTVPPVDGVGTTAEERGTEVDGDPDPDSATA